MSTNNHQITLAQAIAMTQRYRQNQPSFLPVCETFESSVVADLLAEPGCQYLRIYYGMDENNEIHAILVGGNGNNEDILPPDASVATAKNTTEGAVLLEDGYRCPKDCPPPSPLNS